MQPAARAEGSWLLTQALPNYVPILRFTRWRYTTVPVLRVSAAVLHIRRHSKSSPGKYTSSPHRGHTCRQLGRTNGRSQLLSNWDNRGATIRRSTTSGAQSWYGHRTTLRYSPLNLTEPCVWQLQPSFRGLYTAATGLPQVSLAHAATFTSAVRAGAAIMKPQACTICKQSTRFRCVLR